MEAVLHHLLAGAHGGLAYGAIFGVLVACGLGIPLPEDVSLILGGLLVHRGAAGSLGLMMAAGFAGIVAGDSLIFFAGRRVGAARVVRSGLLARIITPEKRAKVEALFARHGDKIVLVARFIPGVRAVTFFTAGSAGMSYARFVLFDATAALASAPLLVYLGYRFGDRIHQIVERVKEGQLSVIFTLLALGLCSWMWKRVRRARAAAAAVKAPARTRID